MADKGKARPEKPQAISINDTPVVHGLNAPTIFVDGAIGVSATGGVMKMNLFQAIQRYDKDGTSVQEREIVARLVMAPHVMASIGQWMTQNAAELLKALTEAGQDGPDQKV